MYTKILKQIHVFEKGDIPNGGFSIYKGVLIFWNDYQSRILEVIDKMTDEERKEICIDVKQSDFDIIPFGSLTDTGKIEPQKNNNPF